MAKIFRFQKSGLPEGYSYFSGDEAPIYSDEEQAQAEKAAKEAATKRGTVTPKLLTMSVARELQERSIGFIEDAPLAAKKAAGQRETR